MKRLLLTVMLFFAVLSLFSFSLVDDLGRIVEFEETPQRIVVAAPVFTDYLVRLGVADRIVGVTEFEPFDAEKIGRTTPLNIEKIVSLEPDLIIVAGGFQAGEVAKLDKFDLKVICLNPNSMETIFRTTNILATICGKEEKGNEIVETYRDKMMAIAEGKSYKIPIEERKKVFYAMIAGTEIKDLWTCGQGSFLNEAISLAGGVNIAGNCSGPSGWLPISVEFVASQNPDAIIVPYYYQGGEQQAREAILNFSPWKNVTAVKNEDIIGIDGEKASHANLKLVDLIADIYSGLYE